jgi:hypothetical protein
MNMFYFGCDHETEGAVCERSELHQFKLSFKQLLKHSMSEKFGTLTAITSRRVQPNREMARVELS